MLSAERIQSSLEKVRVKAVDVGLGGLVVRMPLVDEESERYEYENQGCGGLVGKSEQDVWGGGLQCIARRKYDADNKYCVKLSRRLLAQILMVNEESGTLRSRRRRLRRTGGEEW